MIMIDTDVVIDLREEDGRWFDWSANALARARVEQAVSISAAVIGELAIGGDSLSDIEERVSQFGLTVTPLDASAAYLAGRAQAAYRAAGGSREKLLADFLIGGHAVSIMASLVTRDPKPYRRYFPDLTLITPETDHG